jgi:hypothetical protein
MPYADPEIRKQKANERMAAWRNRRNADPVRRAEYLARIKTHKRAPENRARANAYKKKIAHTDKGREQLRQSQRRIRMKRKGITLAVYDALLEAQVFSCAICGSTTAAHNNITSLFAVDHCHRTGKVRGLLCWKLKSACGQRLH